MILSVICYEQEENVFEGHLMNLKQILKKSYLRVFAFWFFAKGYIFAT